MNEPILTVVLSTLYVRFISSDGCGNGASSITFNSLCEIQELLRKGKPIKAISFNSLCEILIMSRLASWLCLASFNSLCEILRRRINPYSEIEVKTFNSLCEIHNVFEGGVFIVLFIFQLSM